MPQIRPVSDLRNNFAEISRVVHETAEPVFLTKNGYGDMVVMSMETFERHQFQSEVFLKLKEAELEAETTSKRYSHKDVFDELRAKLSDRIKSDNV
ncbi:type II toxin-antitoxin system Phd/YefM family antitoxin [Paradesulfitobacterium ferrireducens]|uniref:type II toxin-antitoxin system Phd/YefM family antitoxin n=1 Tax=Paradesulfitobacterium ferrireducens TaxID=2816476 RepID=UPI001A8F6B33|nr:type II toxin-antitoxin system Phd/YefM family antitoxin [Paradesulfitobacterium ferrireducens]